MPELDIQAILQRLVEARVEFLLKIVSYEDLVKLKELAGRPEDLTDLQRLQEAHEG